MTISRTAPLQQALLAHLELAFEGDEHGNWFTGLLAAVAPLDADAASRPARPGGPTIAGHVEHVRFSLHEMAFRLRGHKRPIDWDLSWATRTVDDAAWDDLRAGLRREYDGLAALVRERDDWNEADLAALLAQAAHTAYHAGAVRQIVRADA